MTADRNGFFVLSFFFFFHLTSFSSKVRGQKFFLRKVCQILVAFPIAFACLDKRESAKPQMSRPIMFNILVSFQIIAVFSTYNFHNVPIEFLFQTQFPMKFQQSVGKPKTKLLLCEHTVDDSISKIIEIGCCNFSIQHSDRILISNSHETQFTMKFEQSVGKPRT